MQPCGTATKVWKEALMYYQVVSQCTQSLKSIEAWLDKAEQFAAATHQFGLEVVLAARPGCL